VRADHGLRSHLSRYDRRVDEGDMIIVDQRTAKEQIEAVLLKYSWGIDSKDWTLFESCFTEDVKLIYGAGKAKSPHVGGKARDFKDRADLVEYIRDTHSPLDGTLHAMSNIAITIESETTASARTYGRVVLTKESHPKGSWFETGGYYEDKLTFDGSDWRISERRYTRVWSDGNLGILSVD
jgi:hypothetical protein